MSSYSRQELRDALQVGCAWDSSALDNAITARFPGTGAVDLGDLIDAWAADSSLPALTLCHCVSFAARLSRQRHMPVFIFPRPTRAKLRAELQRLGAGL